MIAVGVGMVVPAVVKMMAGTDPLDMVVVAFLAQADLVLEPEYLLAVLAGLAVHVAGTVQDLVHPGNEGLDDQGMIVEIAGLDDGGVGIAFCGAGCRIVDPPDKNPGKEKVGEDDDAPETQPDDMIKRRCDQRET